MSRLQELGETVLDTIQYGIGGFGLNLDAQAQSNQAQAAALTTRVAIEAQREARIQDRKDKQAEVMSTVIYALLAISGVVALVFAAKELRKR